VVRQILDTGALTGRSDTMAEWRELIDEALQLDDRESVEAHRLYTAAAEAAIAEAQGRLNDSWTEPSHMMETVYGAMSAYSNQVLARMRAEGSEAGSVDHAFRTGQAYGVSCVLNHIIDRLRDPSSVSQLPALDQFSDEMHAQILADAMEIGLTVELLDAKGDLIED